ncbi:SPOR domain-containing protein [Mucilaginibacter sp. SP1R1]|uniref:HU domain-containing protein n=1 Tax=Mucilaginibacter sp. SP1R1 TaxID=2723091 RepID=UPI001621856A|nr:SPOR domain-containing protein [Mucilaginibacter sp. SP1R1]MBB6147832.1 cell division septation protein DedD [Mucilaginibacter sp. SP1R1]
MDIANYLSELLDQHGKVSLPGLGYFTQVRVNGYYNDAERQFYPPAYQIKFSPQLLDDDVLVQYIAEKKKISLASSKYFTEKYITSLKQEVALNQVTFANLGWFYMDHDQIAFKPQEKRNDAPDFYGFEPVAIKKLHQEQEPEAPLPPPVVVTEHPVAVTEQPIVVTESTVVVTEQPAVIEQPVAVIAPPQDDLVYDEPEDTKRSVSIWLIILIVAVVIAAGAFGLYKYNPALFNFNGPGIEPTAGHPTAQPAVKPDTVNTDTEKVAPPPVDTAAKAISKADTTLNKPVIPVAVTADTIAKPEYVIFAGAFRTAAKSNEAVQNLKSIGIEARILNGAGTGRLIKVIIGHFATYPEGETERIKLLKAGKIRKDSYTQFINQKK